MEERRQHERRRTDLTVEVFDRYSGRCLGRLADLSSEGFMLCGSEVPAADSVLECRLVPHPPLHELGEIELGADCLWSRGGSDGQLGWAGFHIIDLADSQAAALEALIALL
ncbi:PilZ domain-containing protein [Pseudomonas panipatensis]|uniref:PilZ domain-containing protein n=1 Tax=Pseudomonas panipatensis TaxID=428992 RepID=A0A1G8MJ99_9PSED|nr:PilZ domain-containing protein [Pseudomonas panipatensis]SDI67935.1 PilZ domain-containing protein [Pseudomonas panipatensis]SMP77283.1 PilZ domain-containing protein [Pseudomonas panipatensis]